MDYMICLDQRELGRRERATAEYYRTLDKYWVECGTVTIYSLSARQLKQVLTNEKSLDEIIKEINEEP